MAEDIEVLEHYLASDVSGGAASGRPYSLVSSKPGNPIVYLTVPRQRKGHVSTIDAGRTQREIIEQILGRFKNDVVALCVHSHPMLLISSLIRPQVLR